LAGRTSQGASATAIGDFAGNFAQGAGSIAIGVASGSLSQQSTSIAFGYEAGKTSQGANSIAIGFQAGLTGQHARTTILNAQGSVLNSDRTDALFVAPIRNTGTNNILCYNSSSKELTYNTSPSFGQQMVRLNTANGYGSVNTACRRWTNVVANVGTDITYADSATNGATFTINTSGVYGVSYTEAIDVSSDFAVTINSTAGTVLPTTFTEYLCIASCFAASRACAAGTYYLTAGDVIRTQAVSASTSSSQFFTIVRVA
jgi:hypothetical protein